LGVALSTAALVACSPKDAGGSSDAAAGEAGVVDDGASAYPALDAALPPLSGIRLANWSPDAPAIDFCLAPHGTTQFRGPLLGAMFDAELDAGISEEGGLPGVNYPQVSSYLYVPAAQYDARIVAPGSPDCSVGVLTPDDTNVNVVLNGEGTMATLALIGDVMPPKSEPSVTLTSFRDDFATNLADTGIPFMPTRFINASPSTPSISFGSGDLADFDYVQYFAGVPFGEAGDQQEADNTEGTPPAPVTLDPNGYLPLGGIALGNLSVHAYRAKTDLAVAQNVSVPPGIVMTIVAVGDTHLQILQCFDSAGTAGLLSTCSIISM
jgi:hypothetical protein